MIRNFKRIVSLVLVMAISIGVSLPAFAAEKDTPSQSANEVVLQRQTGTETIKLPASMSQTELSKLKYDIQLYGNQKLSQEEVNRINAKAGASGLVYGPWFGGVDKYYAASVTETITYANGIYGVFSAVAGPLGIPTYALANIASSIISIIGGGYVQPGQWIRTDVVKKYREVKYSDGTFAYFQTGFWTNNLIMANKGYGSPYAILSGQLD